jgi:hypothetical protein
LAWQLLKHATTINKNFLRPQINISKQKKGVRTEQDGAYNQIFITEDADYLALKSNQLQLISRRL